MDTRSNRRLNMETKRCRKCGETRPISEYYRHRLMFDGYLNICKKCVKSRVKNNPRARYKSKNSYDRTEKGVIRVIYKTQKGNSKRRGL